MRWITGLVMAILIAGFAAANRQAVSITWSPFHEPLELPLYLVTLGLMATGFILGAFLTWMDAGKLRKTRRSQKKHIKELEQKLDEISQQETEDIPPSDFFPSLPKPGHRNINLAKKLGIKR